MIYGLLRAAFRLTALLLADRFRLDSAATALLLVWATILFWITLPLVIALGLIR